MAALVLLPSEVSTETRGQDRTHDGRVWPAGLHPCAVRDADRAAVSGGADAGFITAGVVALSAS
jgi:hypothetical protein